MYDYINQDNESDRKKRDEFESNIKWENSDLRYWLNNDIYLNDVLGEKVNFHYTAKAMFFYPFEEKDFDEAYEEAGGYYYPSCEILDKIEDIKVLTYDDKGYVTEIYKRY